MTPASKSASNRGRFLGPFRWRMTSFQSTECVAEAQFLCERRQIDERRITPIGLYGCRRSADLTVGVLDRRDVLAMKIYARRPRDIADIFAMHPTAQELAFTRRRLPRIEGNEPERMAAMTAFLDEFEARVLAERQEMAPRRSHRVEDIVHEHTWCSGDRRGARSRGG